MTRFKQKQSAFIFDVRCCGNSYSVTSDLASSQKPKRFFNVFEVIEEDGGWLY